MSKKPFRVLVVHAAGANYWADDIVKGLLSEFAMDVITLEDVLLNGEPINLRKIVDESDVVVVVDDRNLMDDLLVSTIVEYAKAVGKIKPVTIDKPSIRFGVEMSGYNIIYYDQDRSSTFWLLLSAHILLKTK